MPEPEPGVCIYAIGDVHGRSDLLSALLDRIVAHSATLPDGVRRRLVFLGDYIDRGPDSRGVLDLLCHPPPPGFDRVCLRGNHESFLLDFLDTPAKSMVWLVNGGKETLESYGIAEDAILALQQTDLAAAFEGLLPPAHRRFLEGLELVHSSGDYVFVHAGIDPDVPLHRQGPETLLWIREPFLSSRDVFGGRVVVHGHTVSAEPQVRPNRIGIDTGAYASGRLTALVVFGPRRDFLSTPPEMGKEPG